MRAMQGIETVRRDNCLLVKDVITNSMEKMLIEKDVDGAVAYVKATISNLLMNRIDLSLLVITKVLPSTFALLCGKLASCTFAKIEQDSSSRQTNECGRG